MPLHHDCHCKHCSTNPSKRAKRQPPPPQQQSTGQTVRVLDITTRDIFPCLKIPARIFAKVKRDTMPPWIRLEKCETTKEYEKGWNYVETRHGRLVMVRNKKDSQGIHHGGWKKTKPRERAGKEYILVERDNEQVCRERPAQPRGGKVFIDIDTPRYVRRGSSDSVEVMPPTSRPRIQVRRPIHVSPPSPHWDRHDPREARPHHFYVNEADARLVKRVPVEKLRLQRVRPIEIIEEDTYCEDIYDDMLEDYDNIPTREPRPYHIPEPENSFWDDELQAWVVHRRPRVRFE